LLGLAQALRPGQPALGLEIGAGVTARHVGVLGYLILASDSLEAAMGNYLRYERLLYGVNLARAQTMGSEVEIRWPPTQLGRISDEAGIAAFLVFLRRQFEQPLAPTLVTFMHPASPAEIGSYEAFFGCPVRFGDPATRVRFPITYLGLHMPRRDPGLLALLDQQARALLAALPSPSGLDLAVQQLMVSLLPDGAVSLDKLARAMHQSSRSLQRHLAALGLTWQQLLDRTREQLARQYLEDRRLSLDEIALLLGYSEQSAFSRAFRRWTGLTPLAYQKQSGS
jgi:AraC-like DNA-binding protein